MAKDHSAAPSESASADDGKASAMGGQGSPPSKKASPTDDTLTPAECAAKCGQVVTGPKPHRRKSFSPSHLAAATLHGWNAHAHHAGEPFLMSIGDYEKALAAPGNVYEDRRCRPHEPARSKWCPHPKLKAGKKVASKES